MPKISVLMPAYNAEKYIKEAIDSILAQTFSDFELIIIDDGSTDRTAEIVNDYSDSRIRFCPNEKNMGVAATLNRGLALASGEYIARMDADDISKEERFSKQVGYLDAHADIAVCGTSIELFCDGTVIGTRFPSTELEKLKEDLFFSCGIAHPSVMMRKAAILELGGYDPAFNGMEDYELWCRVAEKNKIAVLPEILFRYRIHRGQVTQNPSPKYKEQMRELKKLTDRTARYRLLHLKSSVPMQHIAREQLERTIQKLPRWGVSLKKQRLETKESNTIAASSSALTSKVCSSISL